MHYTTLNVSIFTSNSSEDNTFYKLNELSTKQILCFLWKNIDPLLLIFTRMQKKTDEMIVFALIVTCQLSSLFRS